MRNWIVCAALLCSTPALGAEPADLPDRFIAAWNAHDLAAFANLYTADAVWVPVAEERTKGREAIISEFAKIHAGKGWALRTTIAKRDAPEVQELRPDVATVFFHMDFLMNGQPVPGMQRAMILVATKENDGEWRVAAGQLTKESPPPAN